MMDWSDGAARRCKKKWRDDCEPSPVAIEGPQNQIGHGGFARALRCWCGV